MNVGLMMERQRVPLAIAGALAIVPLLTRDDYTLGVWTFILLNVLVVVGLDLLLGYAGQLSLGHGAFVAVGAYVSALLTTKAGWSGWGAMPVGMLAAAVLAGVIAVPTLRLRGYYLAMATLGFPILFDAVIRVGSSWSGGSSGVTAIPGLMVKGVPLRDPAMYYWLVLGVVTIVLLLAWNIANSRLGLKLRAIHADETAALARGIPVVRVKVMVFVLSAAIAALSGSLYVHNVQFVAAGTFGLQYSLMLVVMLVAGGMGRIWGGVAGVVVLGWLPELLRGFATWQPVIFGSLLVAIMLFSPSGLAGSGASPHCLPAGQGEVRYDRRGRARPPAASCRWRCPARQRPAQTVRRRDSAERPQLCSAGRADPVDHRAQRGGQVHRAGAHFWRPPLRRRHHLDQRAAMCGTHCRPPRARRAGAHLPARAADPDADGLREHSAGRVKPGDAAPAQRGPCHRRARSPRPA
jgi:branched-chain amino acid transport system permease protein